MAKTVANEKFRFEYTIAGDDAKKELGDLELATRKVNEENKELRLEKGRLAAQNKQNTQEYKDLTARIKENTNTVTANKARMEVLRGEIGLTGLTMKQLSAEASKLKLQLHNMTPGTAQYKAFEARLQAVDARMRELRTGARATESSMSRWAGGFNKYAALAAGFAAVLTGVVFKLQEVIDFNGKMSESMSDVQKTTGMAKSEVEDLAKGFGMLQTRTSRINLLSIAEQGGRIGIAKEEIADFVRIMDKAVVALGDEFPGGAEETANSLGKLKQLFVETRDLGVDEAYNGIGSAINELGANGLANAPSLANFATRVGAMPDALRPSITAALGLGAAFQESGLEAEVSARAYSIFLGDVTTKSAKFAQVMGISQQEVEDLVNTDPTAFFLEFAEGLKGMNATEIGNTLNFLGLNADGVNKILGAASSNTQLFRDKMILANDAMLEGTSLIDEYNIKNNNFQATLDKIGKTIRGAFVSDFFVGFLHAVVNGFAVLIGATDDAGSSMNAVRKTIVFLTKVILIAGTAFISYTAAVKLAALWTDRNTKATYLMNIVQRAAAFSTSMLKGAVYLLQIGYYHLTGQLARARGAMVLFTMATNMTPLGAMIGLIAAVTAAYFAFRDAAKAAVTQQNILNDVQAEASKNTAEQVAKIKQLVAIARDETASKKARLAAIKQLNEIAPEYLGNLTLENVKTKEGSRLIDAYVVALNKKAVAEALYSRKVDLLKKRSEADYAVPTADGPLGLGSTAQGISDFVFEQFGIENLPQTLNGIRKSKQELFNTLKESGMSESDAKQVAGSAYNNYIKQRIAALKKFDDELSLVEALEKKALIASLESPTETASGSSFNVPAAEGADAAKKAKATKEARDLAKELKAIMHEEAVERASLIVDSFERELALEKLNHAKRVEELKAQLIDISKLTGEDKRHALEINAIINERILLADKTFNVKKGTLLANNIEGDISAINSGYERETLALKTKQDIDLAAFVGSANARKQFIKVQQQEELAMHVEHAQALTALMEGVLASESYEELELVLLSDAEKLKLLDQIKVLKAKLAELGVSQADLNNLTKDGDNGPFGDGPISGVDVLGFSVADWINTYKSLDTLQGRLAGVGQAIGALSNIYAGYSGMMQAREQQDMQVFARNQEQRRDALQRRLDGGFINQQQYNKAVQAMEQEAAKKQAELDYNRAKREQLMAVAGIISNGAMAVAKAIAASPLTVGMPWSGIIAGQTALQLGFALATPLPAKGFEDGLYNTMAIQREQDGKVFNAARGGRSSSGLVSKPTYFTTSTGGFLAGENSTSSDPEMIIDRKTLRGFHPSLKSSLYREVARSQGFEQGYYPQGNSSATGAGAMPSGDSVRLEDLIAQNNAFLKFLIDNGVSAYMSKDMRNTQSLQDELDRYQKLINKSRA